MHDDSNSRRSRWKIFNKINLNCQVIKNIKLHHVILLCIILTSTFTHLWNVIEFPSFHSDEGVYIRRALYILTGNGLHDPASSFDHSQESTSSFDHPFFGQIFLSGIFKLIGYPYSLNPSSELQSIESLYLIPRLIMGILAVLDTFLIYKISERQFNKKVAVASSILFAVMPATWFTRRIVLDSIMLPFILTSIYLALKGNKIPISQYKILCISAGILLGIAIFTKIPALSFIPIVGYFVYQNLSIIQKNTKLINKTKFLLLWFLIPVIIIPCIWPIYSIVTENFDEFLNGVIWQGTDRHTAEKSLLNTAESFFNADPVLVVFGTIGLIYSLLRKEISLIIWVVPYLIFLYLIGWVSHFHFIPIIPVLCISISKFIYDLSRIKLFRNYHPQIFFSITIMIALLGFLTTVLLISTDVSSAQLSAISYIAKEVELHRQHSAFSETKNKIDAENNNLTVIASPISSWIYKYVFKNDNAFSHIRDTKPIKTSHILLLVDNAYKNIISNQDENMTQIDRLIRIYDNTTKVAEFNIDVSDYNRKNYPYSGINSAVIGSRSHEIRTNY
ncbi:MAG: hypothetical protein DA328_03700 [Nitrososphaeraceae archaeon]|nr:hypothetical protein [Nitrososphaeraceae archaeon]